VTATAAQAVVLVDNLDLPTVYGVFLKKTQWLGVQFRTDDQTYRLDSATVHVYGREEITDVFGGVYISVGPGDRPAVQIGSFLIPPNSLTTVATSVAPPTFFPSSEVVLNPNTDYWIVFGRSIDDGGPNPVWFSQQPGPASGAGTFTGRTAGSVNQGETWGLGYSNPLHQMRINATVIPEPVSLATILVGLPVLYSRRCNS
jgi:hypothetical protein